MGKTFTLDEEQIAEIEAARKKNRNKQVEKRLAVLILRGQGMRNKAVAEKVGVHEKLASRWMSDYVHKGIGALVDNHYAGNRRNLTIEEEAVLLEPFSKAANAGEVVDTKEIKKAYVEKVGHEIGSGQIYRVLKRQKWRKVMPRSKHPKAAKQEVIDVAKNKINF
jgi:transposase